VKNPDWNLAHSVRLRAGEFHRISLPAQRMSQDTSEQDATLHSLPSRGQ
jgi:hypothetical protein